MSKRDIRILTGTSGYHYSFWGPGNSGRKLNTFYENKNAQKWLTQYSKHLSSVEINCTRYRKMTPKMCETWKSKVDDSFRFVVKAPTWITHNKKLNNFAEWWEEDFQPCIEVLDETFECVLFQFPPVFKYTLANVEKLRTVKQLIPMHIKCAFEFRDLAWFDENNLLPDLFEGSWTQTIVDVPEIRGQRMNFGNLSGGVHMGVTNPQFVYTRFHGTQAYSCGTYHRKLEYHTDVAASITAASQSACVLAYFNNVDTWTARPFRDIEGIYADRVPRDLPFVPSAVHDAQLYKSLLM